VSVIHSLLEADFQNGFLSHSEEEEVEEEKTRDFVDWER